MGHLQLSPTKDTSEAPLATFGCERVLVTYETPSSDRSQVPAHSNSNVLPVYHVRKLVLGLFLRITTDTCMRTLLNENYSDRESAQI